MLTAMTVVNMIRQIPTFQSCKSGLYRSLEKMVQKLPITQEIILQDPWTQTLARGRFLLSDDSDGTFYSCTSLFAQLYTLQADVEGTVFPLVFALLPNKIEATYRRFFSILKSAVNDRQSVLTPESWMIDFETAARNAVRVLSKHNHLGVFLPLHALCLENCGLTTEFRDNDSFHQLVQRAAILPLNTKSPS